MLLISSCSKDSLSERPIVNTLLPDYAPFTIGSSFNFSSSAGSYINAIKSDTVIFGKVYKNVINTQDGSQTYYLHQNGEYRISGVSPLHAGGLSTPLTDFLFLKGTAAVNSTWSVSVPINSGGLKYTARFDYKILAKDTTHTINNTIYKNVLKVEQKIVNIFGNEELPSGVNHFWYSKQIGLIESDAIKTKLVSYSIK
jgi:hypothetical protein